MDNSIIQVKQIPVIEEQLQNIKVLVTERVNEALKLVCTEETLKSVKEARAELNKEFKEFEDRRKTVKKEIMTPYENFEAVYKDCISDAYKNADTDLKKKIDAVENELKKEKEEKVREYFDEYLISKDIDFITFENANINVTMSASKKSLTEQAKAFIDKVSDDLTLIDTQEHKDEILYEYKKTLNVSASITTVVNRFKAIEEAKAREEERIALAQQKAEAEKKVNETVEMITPEIKAPLAAPTVADDNKIYTTTFTVKGTKTQLKALKVFMEERGIEYVGK